LDLKGFELEMTKGLEEQSGGRGVENGSLMNRKSNKPLFSLHHNWFNIDLTMLIR
jgi:hypothetical protein